MKQSKEKHKKYKYEPEGNNKGVNLQQSNSILLSLSFCFCSFPVGDFSSKSDFAVVEGFFLLPFFSKDYGKYTSSWNLTQDLSHVDLVRLSSIFR